MKPRTFSYHVAIAGCSLWLFGCGSEQKAENAALKKELSDMSSSNSVLGSAVAQLESKVLGLQAKLQANDELRTALQEEVVSLRTKIEEQKRQVTRLETSNQVFSAKATSVRNKEIALAANMRIDKILVRLNRVADEKVKFVTDETVQDREKEKDRLRQLADAEKSEALQLGAELTNLEFEPADQIKNLVNSFFGAREEFVHNFLNYYVWVKHQSDETAASIMKNCERGRQSYRASMQQSIDAIRELKQKPSN